MRTAPVLAAALSASALLATCDDAPSSGEPLAPIEFGASDVEVIGSSDSLAVVQDMEVLSDGSVWVLNSQPPFFTGFGPGGESLGAHGRPGGGPNEFPMPSGFVAGGWDGDAWVFDFARHAIIRISQPGEDPAVIPLRSDDLPAGSVKGGMTRRATSSPARAPSHSGIASGLLAATVSSASMIGSGTSSADSTDRERRWNPSSCRRFRSPTSLHGSSPLRSSG